MKGSILSLDLGSSTGWALASAPALASWPELADLSPGCGPFEGVSYGTLDMRMTRPIASKLCRFYRWYAGVLDNGEVSHVYYEMSLPPQNQSSTQAARISYGLAGIVQGIGFDHLVSLTDTPPSTIKKHFTGRGDAPKTISDLQKRNVKRAKEGKDPWVGPTIEQAIKARGWEPDSGDCADALALLNYAATRQQGGRQAA